MGGVLLNWIPDAIICQVIHDRVKDAESFRSPFGIITRLSDEVRPTGSEASSLLCQERRQ